MSIVRYNRNLGRYVNKVIKSKEEKKIWDRAYAADLINDGVCYDFSQFRYIVPGDGPLERIGNSIDVSSIILRGLLSHPQPGGSLPEPYTTYCRIVVFQWHEDPYLNPPSAVSILSYYNATYPPPNASLISPYAAYNKENAGKFTILYDKAFTTSFYGPGSHKVKINLSSKIPNKTIHYSKNDASTGNFYPTRDNIYMLLISEIDETEYEAPNFAWVSRTVYTDS